MLPQKEGRLPLNLAIADARQKVNWRHVKASEGGIRLAGRDTKITLNGIAQGYAADRALAALKEHGIEHALVDAGELAAKGAGSQKPGWQIGVQHPRHEDAYIALAMLQDRCFSTTGDYATTFGRDYRFHHVFDPQTGVSPQEISSVSVAAPTAMQADAWSTAAFVMGPEKACEVLRTLPGHDALFVLKDGRMLTTPGFPLFDEGSAS
ncbi:MAG: FAD:protein FMN transferase [Pirellulales bacterium]